MRHILIADLPSELALWLEQSIDEVLVRATSSGEETLVALAWDGWSALVIDHDLPGIPAPDVVSLARDELELGRLPVFYCLKANVGNDVAAGLAQQIGLGQLLFHPVNWDVLSQRVELAIRQIDYHAERMARIVPTALTPAIQLIKPVAEERSTELASDDRAVMVAAATAFEDNVDTILETHEEKLITWQAR